MKDLSLYNKEEIKNFLEQDPYLHIYSLGDLDDFFWPFTIWYGYRTNNKLKAVILIYKGPDLPTVCALSRDYDVMAGLLSSVTHILPDRFFLHLSPNLENILNKTFHLESGSEHYKMALTDNDFPVVPDTSNVIRLTHDDLPDLEKLYKESYPDNWFDPRMLETNQFFGIKKEDRIVSAAGVHVFSRLYKVAAPGNIVTHHNYRGKGYGTQVTAALCKSLLKFDVRIGLNVQSVNIPAIKSYTKLGFEVIAPYSEFVAQRR